MSAVIYNQYVFFKLGYIPVLQDAVEASAETGLQDHPNLQGLTQYLPDAQSTCTCKECFYITNTPKFCGVCDA